MDFRYGSTVSGTAAESGRMNFRRLRLPVLDVLGLYPACWKVKYSEYLSHISQGSVAASEWEVGVSAIGIHRRFFGNLSAKECWTSADICISYDQKSNRLFHWNTCRPITRLYRLQQLSSGTCFVIIITIIYFQNIVYRLNVCVCGLVAMLSSTAAKSWSAWPVC